MSLAFEGFADRECGEHRTVGKRAWCYSCTEWCYPTAPCKGCELPVLHKLVELVKARYIMNSLNESVCQHGNIEWNCESCDADKDRAILSCLLKLVRDE